MNNKEDEETTLSNECAMTKALMFLTTKIDTVIESQQKQSSTASNSTHPYGLSELKVDPKNKEESLSSIKRKVSAARHSQKKLNPKSMKFHISASQRKMR